MVSHQMYQLYCFGPKMIFRVFWNIRQPSTCEKMKTLCFGRKCTISRYRNWENHFPPNAFSLIHWTNNDVCECLEHFGILRNANWHETCDYGLKALFRDTEIVKMISQEIHPFYSVRLKIMFGTVLEHFVILPHVKSCKTCVLDLNTVFRGTEVVSIVSHQMHQFYSMGQKMMVWIVFMHFKDLCNVKRYKTFV
jgi:hypothetical protein